MDKLTLLIKSTSHPSLPIRPAGSETPNTTAAKTDEATNETNKDSWTSVTFNEESRTFEFQKPGHFNGKSLSNPLKSGLQGAALVGVPALIGAATSSLIGTGGSALVNVALSPLAGGALTGALAARSVFKESRGNHLYAGLAGIVGGAVGSLAYPLLKLPGTLGGFTGAAVAAGVVGGGIAIWAATNNHNIRQEAIEAGWTPK